MTKYFVVVEISSIFTNTCVYMYNFAYEPLI